jgi:hypothetical protein
MHRPLRYIQLPATKNPGAANALGAVPERRTLPDEAWDPIDEARCVLLMISETCLLNSKKQGSNTREYQILLEDIYTSTVRSNIPCADGSGRHRSTSSESKVVSCQKHFKVQAASRLVVSGEDSLKNNKCLGMCL